ncbi:1006_t:CDS:2, partial [Funneliformis geosporum]
ESENAIRNVLRSVRYVLAMDVFANKLTLAFLKAYHGEDIHIIDNRYKSRVNAMVEIFYDPNSRAEAIKIGYGLLRALVEKAFKLSKPDNSPVRACIYYGDMDGKQRQKGFSNINDAWDKLNCVAYTNTVKADISFEITRHFDIVITITNITTSVHVETLAQMLYQIRDSFCHIISLFYQKNSNELFCYDEKSAMKGLKTEKNIQWKIACYRAEENLKKLVVEDLHKSYSANHWEAIRELFQILGFTGINDIHILPGNIILAAFAQSCERFIVI